MKDREFYVAKLQLQHDVDALLVPEPATQACAALREAGVDDGKLLAEVKPAPLLLARSKNESELDFVRRIAKLGELTPTHRVSKSTYTLQAQLKKQSREYFYTSKKHCS